MTRRQKHKGKKRPRSWHRRYNTQDKAYRAAIRKIEAAVREPEAPSCSR